MTSGQHESEEGTEEVGLDVENIGKVGGGCQNHRHLLQGGSEGGAFIRIRDVVDDPPDWTNPGRFPTQGGPPAVRDSTTEKLRGCMGVPTIFAGDVGGGPEGCGYVRPPPTKHYSQIYRDLSNIGYVSGGGAVTGSMDGQDMVVAGGIGLGGSAGGGKGGRGRGADGKVNIWRLNEGLSQRG